MIHRIAKGKKEKKKKQTQKTCVTHLWLDIQMLGPHKTQHIQPPTEQSVTLQIGGAIGSPRLVENLVHQIPARTQ